MKQGDTLIRYGIKAKVLGVCGEAIFINYENYRGANTKVTTEEELKIHGWKLSEEDWTPQHRERYYFISGDGRVNMDSWITAGTDNSRKNFLGIYKTEKLAEQARDRIKNLIK